VGAARGGIPGRNGKCLLDVKCGETTFHEVRCQMGQDSKRRRLLQCEEDVRWSELEEGSQAGVSWSCAACAFLNMDFGMTSCGEVRCQMCGAPLPPSPYAERSMPMTPLRQTSPVPEISPVKESVAVAQASASKGQDLAGMLAGPPTGSRNSPRMEEPSSDLEEEDDEQVEDVEELIRVSLRRMPPAGAVVEVLFEKNVWFRALVTTSNGKNKARIVFEVDGEKDVIDLREHWVRLATKSDDNSHGNMSTSIGDETCSPDSDSDESSESMDSDSEEAESEETESEASNDGADSHGEVSDDSDNNVVSEKQW